MKYNIIIDGGTTNLRVYLLESGSCRIAASARADGGVKHTAIDGNNSHLCTSLKNCLSSVIEEAHCTFEDIDRTVAFGMITSGSGLYEIPHLPAPASADTLRSGMKTKRFEDIAPLDIEFIPGVRNFYGAVNCDNVSGMDMMRGEETESAGLYSLLGLTDSALFILPGSHNKFIKMNAGGEISACYTSISGELLDSITHHTIISDAVRSDFCTAETYNRDLARRGAEECMNSGLGRAAFAGRILKTLGDETPSGIQSWLLGAVLAEDVKAIQSFAADRNTAIYVAGKAPVQQAMTDILTFSGYCNVFQVDREISSKMGISGALKISGMI